MIRRVCCSVSVCIGTAVRSARPAFLTGVGPLLIGRCLFDQFSHGFGLVPLRPVCCVLHQMKRRVLEQSGYLGRQGRVQIAIRFAKDDRDRDLEVAECSTVDQSVLLAQCVEQTRGPAADGCERIRLVGVAEELREDGLYGEAVGVDGIQTPLGRRCAAVARGAGHRR